MQKLANRIPKQHIPALRAVLLSMLAAGAAQERDIGVCGNVHRGLARHAIADGTCRGRPSLNGYDAVAALADNWPEARRYPAAEDGTTPGELMDFFVPVDYTQTEDCCLVEVPLWEGPQLERRMDLVKHMLTQLGLLEQYYNEQEAALTA